ncbi:MAG: CHASE3 domain-containing protein [Isosphaeraceae bacterium]
MGKNLERIVLAGAGLIIALLIVVAWLNYRNTRELDEDTRLVAHTHEVLDLIGEVQNALLDAETGQRGYLLTGREQYLQPYRAALRRFDEDMAALKRKTSDNLRQQARIKKLADMSSLRLAWLKKGIELRQQGAEQARLFMQNDAGEVQMDTIRELANQMRHEEGSLLWDRQKQSKASYATAITTCLLTAMIGVVLVGAIVWLLQRSLQARERAAAVLHEQREWFRITLAGIGDGVIATDTEGRVRFLNGVAQNLTAWQADEARDQPLETVFRIVKEETRLPVENPAMRALREGLIVGLANHTILIARDGTERPIDDSAAAIQDASGKTVGAVLVFRDVTSRRKAEEELADRMRLLSLCAEIGTALTQVNTLPSVLECCARHLAEHLNCALVRIWTLSPGADVLELKASAGLSASTRGSRARIPVGTGEIGRIARERRPHFTNRVFDDATIQDQAWVQTAKLVAFAGFPLLVDDRVVGVIALFARHALPPHAVQALEALADQIAIGIERKWSEQEVARLLAREQERSERLRQIAQASLTINSATSPASVADVLRGEAQRIIGTADAEVCLDAQEAPPVGGLSAPLGGRGGRLLGYIHLAGKTDGPFTRDDESILYQLAQVAAVALDNARLNEELRESDRRKDEFLATLAHELRNPLAPIRNSIQVMKLADHDLTAIEASRAIIERQIRQMVRLVDDLLDVSRISRGKIVLQKRRVDLATVLAGALETSRPLIDQARHHLTVSLPMGPIPLWADPTRLAQVFLNILNNAAKYTDPGGEISLLVERDENCVVARVRDSGVGIPADMIQSIFNMFIQVDHSLERGHGGLGIGLTLVKRLVEMHGGSVAASSEGPGRGSEFVVRLPVSPPDEAIDSKASGVLTSSACHRRILVADDNSDSIDSLATMLRMLGNQVQTAADGVEAVEAALSFRPEIVLMDIGLPRLNGFDAARQIRDLPGGQAMVLVALTGWGQEGDRRRSREVGFDHHIVKPVDPVVLEELLARMHPAPS